MDYSTINIEKLKKLPVYKLPPTYRLQHGTGNGCYGDAPGYPTYFTKAVYNSTGNTPRNAPRYVIEFEEKIYIVIGKDCDYEQYNRFYKSLYSPLPIDHERVRLWIKRQYQHFQHCYWDVSTNKTVIYPIPGFELKSFVDDERFSDEWRKKEKFAIDQANKELIEHHKKICTPENHSAVTVIREFYPDYSPEIDLINNPPEGNIPTWWEVHSKCPNTAEECSSQNKERVHYGPHPINKTWCQHCGWKKEK
jgi:hypothetical protein